MSGSDPTLYLLAAYGVTAGLIAAEVWMLVRRCRAQSRTLLPSELHDEA